MAANKDVQDFFELRAGVQGMQDFAEAAIRFLDRHGIALQMRTRRAKTNGAVAHVDVETIRTKAKEMFAGRGGKRRKNSAKGQPASEPDGKHVSVSEAAKLLKMSDANVRIMMIDGRLPKPTYELRTVNKDRGPVKVQVLAKDDVQAYIANVKAEAKKQTKGGGEE